MDIFTLLTALISFNCQMGRGRTSTGMIAGAIIASIDSADDPTQLASDKADEDDDNDYSEETAYLNGMWL